MSSSSPHQFTFNTLPINLAVQITTFLDQVESLSLFNVSKRWKQISESDGVALHQLQKYGVLEQQNNEDNSNNDDDQQQNNNNNNVSRFRDREHDQTNPRSLLINDPDFGSASPQRIAHLTKTFQEFRSVCEATLYNNKDLEKISYLGKGLKNFQRDIDEGVIIKHRDVNYSSHLRGGGGGAEQEAAAENNNSEEKLKKNEELRRDLYMNVAPLEVRLIFRFLNGMSKYSIYSPFGVSKCYNDLEAIQLFDLDEAIAHATAFRECVIERTCFPIARWGDRYVIFVLNQDLTSMENEQEKVANGEGGGNPDDNYRSETHLRRHRMICGIQKKGAVVAMFRGSTIPVAPSLEHFLKYFISGLSPTNGINPLHRVVEWPITMEDVGIEVSDLRGDGDSSNNNNADNTISSSSMNNTNDTENDAVLKKILTQKLNVISAFPSSISDSPKKRNCSLAKTSTIAGDIFVEMSATLLPSRSVFVLSSRELSAAMLSRPRSQFFYAYRCRIWRETTSPEQEQYLPALASRSWKIFQTKEEKERDEPADTVEGEGVIGLYPKLLPLRQELANNIDLREKNAVWKDSELIDGVFEYASGTAMPKPFGGSMEGYFVFRFYKKRRDREDAAQDALYQSSDLWETEADTALGIQNVAVGNFTCEFGNYNDENIPFVFC